MHTSYFCTILLFEVSKTFELVGFGMNRRKVRRDMRGYGIPPNGRFTQAVNAHVYMRKSFSGFCFEILVVHTVG